ncbi:MAG TPA: DUF2946 family protein [Steroidobacteraceae bacterium]|jgi:hypothetical protein|nr:DUF2946 family protein [Steroidobacteraceae bacterium]
MPRSALTRLRSRRDLVVGLLLAVFVLRAFVPAGYMPSAGASLLEMCREGIPASTESPAQSGDQSGDHAAGEHCLFAAPAAAPLLQSIQFVSPPPVVTARLSAVDLPLVEHSLRRAQQARGPPLS